MSNFKGTFTDKLKKLRAVQADKQASDAAASKLAEALVIINTSKGTAIVGTIVKPVLTEVNDAYLQGEGELALNAETRTLTAEHAFSNRTELRWYVNKVQGMLGVLVIVDAKGICIIVTSRYGTQKKYMSLVLDSYAMRAFVEDACYKFLDNGDATKEDPRVDALNSA